MAIKQTGEQILEQLMREGGPRAQQAAAAAIQDLKIGLSKTMKDTLETAQATGKITKQTAVSQKEGVEISKVANQNIKDLKSGQKELITLTKQTNGFLNNLLSASNKYFESNNEFLQNLLLRNSLDSNKLNDKLEKLFDKQNRIQPSQIAPITNTGNGGGDDGGGSTIADAVAKAIGSIAAAFGTVKTAKVIFGRGAGAEPKAPTPAEEVPKPKPKRVTGVESDTKPRATDIAKKTTPKGVTGVESDTKPTAADKAKKTTPRVSRGSGAEPRAPTPAEEVRPAPKPLVKENVYYDEKTKRFKNRLTNNFVKDAEATALGLKKPGTITRAPVPTPETGVGVGKVLKGAAALGAAVNIIAAMYSSGDLAQAEEAKGKVQKQLANGEITEDEAVLAFKEIDFFIAGVRGQIAAYEGTVGAGAGIAGGIAGVAATPVTSPVGGFVIGTAVGMATDAGLRAAAEATGAKPVLEEVGKVTGEVVSAGAALTRNALSSLTGGYIYSDTEATKRDLLTGRFTAEENAARAAAEEEYQAANKAAPQGFRARAALGLSSEEAKARDERLALAKANRDKINAETEAKRLEREKIYQAQVQAQVEKQRLSQQQNTTPVDTGDDSAEPIVTVIPAQKLNQQTIAAVDTPTSTSSNVTIINQGDNTTVTGQGNAGGSNQSSPGVGSPSAPNNPFDARLYGKADRRNGF